MDDIRIAAGQGHDFLGLALVPEAVLCRFLSLSNSEPLPLGNFRPFLPPNGGINVMGILSGKEDSDGLRKRREKAKQKRKERQFKTPPPRQHRAKSFPDRLGEFHKLNDKGEYDEAMKLWYELTGEFPQDLAGWLDENQTFVPPYGVHYGADGTEPWRPIAQCQCGFPHRWGDKDYTRHNPA